MSPRQQQLVVAVEELTGQRGYPPTIMELAVAMRVSRTRVGQLVAACQQKGLLVRDPRRARSLRVCEAV